MNKQLHPSFGIYCHIPFCEKKCIYCDFYSLEKMDHKDIFVSMLKKEITTRSLEINTQQIASSVFFGGGTPSLMSVEQMRNIIHTIRESWTIHPNAEWTMECNPGTITLESLKGYKELGINRLSFGIQTFNQEELNFLHRIHTPDEAIQAVELARKAGFDNINIDLIFALPNQSFDSWKDTLAKGIALNTEHISAYSLIFEEKTPLFTMLQKGLVTPSDDDKDADMYAYTIQTLAEAGYEQYEVSNFAKKGYSCIHNRTYWQAKEYMAFGPSAHGYIQEKRYWNYRNLVRYLEAVQKNGSGEASFEKLSRTNQLFEYAFLGFRAEGLSIQDFQQKFSIDLMEVLAPKLSLWVYEKLVEVIENKEDRNIRLTSSGYAVCDELSVTLIELLEKNIGISWEQSGYEEQDDEENPGYIPISLQ